MSDLHLHLHPHETARLRELRPGEELLVVRPMEPQPTHSHIFSTDRREHPCCSTPDGTCGGEIKSPHRPGDVVSVGHRWESVPGGLQVAVPRYRLTLARVEARRVREVTRQEWIATGVVAATWGYAQSRIVPEEWWTETYAPLGPDYAWDRAWAWCEWWQLAAQQGGEEG